MESLLSQLFPDLPDVGDDLKHFPGSRAPGRTAISRAIAMKLLRDNHLKYHCYLNNEGHHNHTSHHIITLYGSGASPQRIETAYEEIIKVQKAMFESPGEINENNWKSHLGDETYYRAYLRFFDQLVLKLSPSELVSQFLFDVSVNVGSGPNPPAMVARLVSGAVHSIIYLGFALEYDIPGLLSEALAQTAIHDLAARPLFPDELWLRYADDYIDHNLDNHNRDSLTKTNIFDVVGRVLKEPSASAGKASNKESIYVRQYDEVVESLSSKLNNWANEWYNSVLAGHGKVELSERVKELAFVSTVLFGVGGWKLGKLLVADFFNIHIVTATFAIPYIVRLIKPHEAQILLQGFLAVALAVYICRGRPSVDIASFMQHTSIEPGPRASNNIADSPWITILQSSIAHPGGKLYGEHIIKTNRAMMQFASMWGELPTGTFHSTELSGVETLDGTIFVRVAGLLLDRMGWDPTVGDFDRDGFFDE